MKRVKNKVALKRILEWEGMESFTHEWKKENEISKYVFFFFKERALKNWGLINELSNKAF